MEKRTFHSDFIIKAKKVIVFVAFLRDFLPKTLDGEPAKRARNRERYVETLMSFAICC